MCVTYAATEDYDRPDDEPGGIRPDDEPDNFSPDDPGANRAVSLLTLLLVLVLVLAGFWLVGGRE